MDEKDKSRYLGDVEYFSAKLEQDPSSVLFIPLAKAYIKLEKFEEAVEVLTAGIDANSDMLSAKTMLAKAYLGLGNKDDAKAVLTEVQVVDRNNYLASKLMGDIQRNDDDLKKALVSYRNALLVAPEDAELRNLVEELMSKAGIAAHELDEEISLMEADDEMLDQLGSELAEEVRQQVGEAEFGTAEASADDVGKAIDDIIGGKAMTDEEDEMSLDSFEEDTGFGEELEEELVASFEDSIVPTDLSADDAEPVVVFDEEIMKSEGEDEPDEDDVKALAAELGADLGFDLGEPPAEEPDDVDRALEEVFSDGEAEEGTKTVDGMSFFEGVDAEPDEDVDEQKLLEELSGESPDAEKKPDDDVAAAMAELEAEQSEEKSDEPEEIDDVAAAMAELEAEQSEEKSDEPEEVDDVAAAMAELEAEQSEEKSDEPEEIDDVAAAMAELEAEQSEEKPDEPEEIDDVAVAMAELEAEQSEEKSDEPEEIDDVAAAMAELEAEQSEEKSDEPEEIDDVALAMAELEAEQSEEKSDEPETEQDEDMVDEPVSEEEEVKHAQSFDELQELLADAEAVEEESEDGAKEPEDGKEPEEEESGKEIFEASLDELMETGPEETAETDGIDYEKLPPETREHVNKLENLLEIIKNKSSG